MGAFSYFIFFTQCHAVLKEMEGEGVAVEVSHTRQTLTGTFKTFKYYLTR